MKKKWGAFIYVPILACLVAGGGAYIWKLDQGRTENTPNQVYYLDEYFEAEANRSSEAHVVDEKDVILENFAESSITDAELNVTESIIGEKTESVPESQTGFILQLVDNHVLVYRLDNRNECYMSTGIRAEDLPEKTLKEIIEGKEILDEESLYFFLESYSS